MLQDKIKPELSGATETLLPCIYARAKYSRSPNPKIYDAKAIEIIDKIDYDFDASDKDIGMNSGVIARTIVLDELVGKFIEENENCTIVNVGCGLDTRFYRLDNGKITWYNLDLPETIHVRDQIFKESGRVSTIPCSATDPKWPEHVTVRGKMLFIIEGLSMYLTRDEVKQMIQIIRNSFDNAYVIMECLPTMFVDKMNLEKSIEATGAKFYFGCYSFDELGDIVEGFTKVKDDNINRGFVAVHPTLKLIAWWPIFKKYSEKLLIFKKE